MKVAAMLFAETSNLKVWRKVKFSVQDEMRAKFERLLCGLGCANEALFFSPSNLTFWTRERLNLTTSEA